VHVSGAAGTATKSVTLTAGTIHTLVVLDGAGGSLMIDNLQDAAGSAIMPRGGVATGLGGTAPAPAPSPAPWAAAAGRRTSRRNAGPRPSWRDCRPLGTGRRACDPRRPSPICAYRA